MRIFMFVCQGKLSADAQDFEGAISVFNEAISLNPQNVSLFIQRAAAHKALDKYADAYFDYSFAIRLEPENGSHFCSRCGRRC
jgi:Flp pilus assembly protein TadD